MEQSWEGAWSQAGNPRHRLASHLFTSSATGIPTPFLVVLSAVSFLTHHIFFH